MMLVEQLVLQARQQIGKWGRGLSWYNPCLTALPPLNLDSQRYIHDASKCFYFKTGQFVSARRRSKGRQVMRRTSKTGRKRGRGAGRQRKGMWGEKQVKGQRVGGGSAARPH